MTDTELCSIARAAMKKAYNPYSGFAVGAALLCGDGRVYEGCNIENSAYTPTVCAERVAFFKAVSDGERKFIKIAVAGAKDGKITAACPPCGVCRQVMSEFCGRDFEILAVTAAGFEKYTLEQLLPVSFDLTEVQS